MKSLEEIMETQILQPEKPTGTNRNIFIIAGVLIALGCCCLALAGVGFYAYQNYKSSLPLQSVPEVFTPIPPSVDSTLTSRANETGVDEAPTDGLGNDILKNDTWRAVSAAAVSLGCDQPIGSQSTIEVLQQPDNAGVWDERWTVACQSGKTYAFKVEFILDSTGATYNITPLP
jgi:hypothetical protein